MNSKSKFHIMDLFMEDMTRYVTINKTILYLITCVVVESLKPIVSGNNSYSVTTILMIATTTAPQRPTIPLLLLFLLLIY